MNQPSTTIAVVTGASRGAGRAIALELGAAGATVYVTGRSTGDGPGTIDETAALVAAQGGTGIAVRCDHTDDAQVDALFAQVAQEQGRLDVLVNNVWGGYEGYDETFVAPFWEQPLWRWEGMFTAGVRAHFLATRHAVPLLLQAQRGVVVLTTAWDRDLFLGSVVYDTAKAAVNRLAFGMAHDLRPHGIAVLALAPGFMRTEAVLAAFDASEDTWQQVPGLERTESPHYVGRAIVALAGDPAVLAKTGHLFAVGALAQEYGFTDVDGRQPPPFHIDEE
jgi:NAD(P)-dependent dehydrogenase (short-subunit alcohol dehydrogenase family)